jgi:hypothetical protein
MSEYADVLVSYLVGTGAGLYLFKRYVQEGIIQRTIDMLVQEDYVRSYVGDDGELHLHKWYELDDVIEVITKEQEENSEEEDDA